MAAIAASLLSADDENSESRLASEMSDEKVECCV